MIIYRLVLLLILLLWPLPVQSRQFNDKVRITILPFETPEGITELRQYGVGTMDSLITSLKHIPSFIMIDRARIERIIQEQGFQQSGLVDTTTAVKVGKLLGAQVVVAGSIQTSGHRVRLVAHFIDIETGQISDSQKVTGILDNIFDLQDEMANLFIKNQKVPVSTKQQKYIGKVLKSTTSVVAYDYYLKGRKAYLLFTPMAYEEAIQSYQKAVRVDPRYALAYAGLAETWNFWGYQKKLKGEPYLSYYKQAYVAAQQALKLNNDLPEAHRAFGMAAWILRKPGAESHTRQALQLNPNDAESWYALWFEANHDRDPDHSYIRKSLELNPDLVVARYDRGVALLELNRHEEAIAEFQAVTRVNPGHVSAHVDMGVSLVQLNRFEEAAIEFQEAIQIDPGVGLAHNGLGVALNHLGRYEEAIAAYQQAIRINFDDAEAHFNLGLLYEELGQWANCSHEWEETLRINPNHVKALKKLPAVRDKLKQF